MADLERHSDDPEEREAWLVWAIEFARRGFLPGETITVHGPHPTAGFMWGEAVGVDGLDGSPAEVRFRTAGCTITGTAARWQVKGVSLETNDNPAEKWPILSASERSHRLNQWIAAARAARDQLRGRNRTKR